MPEVEIRTVAEWQAAGVLRVEDGNHGEYRPRPDEFSDAGVAFIRAADLDAGAVSFASASKINDVAQARITKGVGAPGDILFSHKGTVGKLALVPDEAPQFVCSPQTTFWRVTDRNRVDPRYLYYYMQSRQFRQQWQACKGETDMADYVSLTAQRRLSVSLPPRRAQDCVVEVLFALDDRIDLNRKMSRTLEAMARALFKSWFVGFDPVVAKREGRQPFGMNAETAALFPAQFQESELGPFPEGWHARPLTDLAVFVKGRSYKSAELSESSTALVTLKSFARGGGYRRDGLKCYTGTFKPEQVIVPGEVIVACTDVTQNAEVIGRAARVLPNERFPRLVASLDVLIARPIDKRIPVSFLAELLRSSDYVDHILGYVNGTTVLHLDTSGLANYVVTIPSDAVMRAFDQAAAKLYEQLVLNAVEADTLAALRNLLLPKLLSGKIQLKSAERAVADVV